MFLQHEVIRKTLYQHNINSETSKIGSRTGVKQDGIEGRQENPKLGNISRKQEAREILSVKVRIPLEFIKIIQLIRTGAKIYLGFIAGRKYAGMVEIA